MKQRRWSDASDARVELNVMIGYYMNAITTVGQKNFPVPLDVTL